jgi:hypothetical protein
VEELKRKEPKRTRRGKEEGEEEEPGLNIAFHGSR